MIVTHTPPACASIRTTYVVTKGGRVGKQARAEFTSTTHSKLKVMDFLRKFLATPWLNVDLSMKGDQFDRVFSTYVVTKGSRVGKGALVQLMARHVVSQGHSGYGAQ